MECVSEAAIGNREEITQPSLVYILLKPEIMSLSVYIAFPVEETSH